MVALVLKLLSWYPALSQALALGAIAVGAPSVSTPGIASQMAEETQSKRMPTTSSKQITSLQFLTLQEEIGSEEQGTLPCLDSSRECVEELTQQAIANSPKLKTLDRLLIAKEKFCR